MSQTNPAASPGGSTGKGGASYGVNPMQNSAQGFQQGFNSMNAGMQGLGQYAATAPGGYNPAFANAAPGINQAMQPYQNPYQQQVIDNTAGQMTRDRDQALNQVQGQAAQAGAFGGGRQGLVEQGVYNDANRNIGDMAAQYNRQGYMDQAGLGAQDINNQMQTGFANQNAANQAGQFNNQFGMQQADMLFQNAMKGGTGLGNLAGSSYGVGSDINNQQMQSGQLMQSLQQALFGQGQDMFNQYTGQPSNLLKLRLESLGMNPMNDTGTTTQTNDPGLYGVLGGLLQGGANMFQFNPISWP